jgi:hypothetical protein
MARSAAAVAFEQTLAELGVDEHDADIGDPRSLGRRAALLAVAGTVWGRHLGPLLTTKQVAEMLGVGSRQAVNDRVRRHRILALPTADHGLAYPAFQFDDRGSPYPTLAPVLEAFARSRLSGHTIGSWFVTPQTALDGATPARWLAEGGDADRLVAAAQRSASRSAR